MSAKAKEYIEFARKRATKGQYKKAVDLFLMAFNENAALKPIFEQEFRLTLSRLHLILVRQNKINEMFSIIGRVFEMFPQNVLLMNDIGSCLYNLGYYGEAWEQFQKALFIDSGYVRAERNLNSMKNLLVERWHFRMLNDVIRNKGYRDSISHMVKRGETTVFDLGSGTGLLSMYAAESNPASIIACDASQEMTIITNCVIMDNNISSISTVNKMSNAIDYTEIGGKCSLLVTELFDAGLFGEHVLHFLLHAWQNLLSESAQVVPHSAEFFVLGAHSDSLSAKYQLQSNAKSFISMPRSHVHIASNETYDCDDVHQYNDIKYMTNAATVVKVNFTDQNDINDKLDRIEPYSVELKALTNGEINLLIGFFNLYLTTDIAITTDPRTKDRANAWQQAVFFDYLPRDVEENESININFLLRAGKITMLTNDDKNIIKISPEVIRFLNDTEYMKWIKTFTGLAYMHLNPTVYLADMNVIDLCPFPVFGLYMLKRGLNWLTCYAKTHKDKQFLETVIQSSDVPHSRVTILTGDKWEASSIGNDKYHAIFCNIFELSGDIDLHYKNIAEHLRTTNLIENGLFMPASVTLIAQIVSCNWLDINNRVNNMSYNIATHINKYQVSQNYNLDLSNLEYTPMSDPIVLGDCYQLSDGVFDVTVKNDGDANAILCWYNIELMENSSMISTNRVRSFIDGTAFMVDPIIPMVKDKIANILCCVDDDGAFKLMLDLEAT